MLYILHKNHCERNIEADIKAQWVPFITTSLIVTGFAVKFYKSIAVKQF